MKHTPEEVLDILTKVKNGAKWEYRINADPAKWIEPVFTQFGTLMSMLTGNMEIRIKKEPKRVPLGPEDFVGQCWWIRNPKTCGPSGNPVLVTSPPAWNFYHLLDNGWERTKDGKNWEPCSKLG